MSPQNSQPTKRRRLGGLLLSIIALSASLFVWLHFQYLLDWVNYQTYTPSASISSITAGADLTDEGKFAFYAAQPVLDGTQTFDTRCDRKEQNTAILGCYVNNRIYIYDITDDRLEGIKEVTAVHEMLHVVYQRLSDEEKEALHRLLEKEAAKLENDKDFAERMDFYARTEPGERYNELHSIIGTEVAAIDSELEEHYSRYFDRSTVLSLYKGYKQEFRRLEERAAQLVVTIEALASQINQAKANYVSSTNQLDRDIQDFNRRAESGAFDSPSTFNTERQALLARADKLKDERTEINAMVNRYNGLIREHNNIITESNELYESIDSSLAPAPSV